MAENNTEVTKVAINDIGTEEDFIKVDSSDRWMDKNPMNPAKRSSVPNKAKELEPFGLSFDQPLEVEVDVPG